MVYITYLYFIYLRRPKELSVELPYYLITNENA